MQTHLRVLHSCRALRLLHAAFARVVEATAFFRVSWVASAFPSLVVFFSLCEGMIVGKSPTGCSW
jgi:hypothetical protein